MTRAKLHMKWGTALLAAACLLLTGAAGFAQSTQDAGDWLADQQDEDGWFPWFPGGGPTTNTQGPSALGLLAAYFHTELEGYMDRALLSGEYILDSLYLPDGGVSNWSDGTPRIAMHDPLFLEAMGLATGDSVYTDFLSTYYWDALEAGTYGDANHTAASLGSSVVATRGQLSMWDIAPAAIAAHVAGRTEVRDGFMGAILEGLEAAPGPGTYDVIGLAGAVWASALTGVDLNPTAGRYAGMSTEQLAAELAGMTKSANPGAFMWRSDAEDWFPDDPTNGDLQATAFAIMALRAFDADVYEETIAHGVAFIRSLQLGDGAFDGWLGRNNPNVEGHAEGLTAISAVAPYIVFVDQANAGLGWGDDPAGAGIVVGYDAFGSLTDGIDGVRPEGLVLVAHGDYEATYPIRKPLTLISEEGSTSNTSLFGNMTLESRDILIGRMGQGFSIRDNITVSSGVDASTISINWNDIYGRVTNEGDGTLDARYNWWANRHPRNATTGEVNYRPFLPRPVDEVIAFIERTGLPVTEALSVMDFLDGRGIRGELAWELRQKFGFTLDEGMQLISDFGIARVRRAARQNTYERFLNQLAGYDPQPAGGAGTFVDKAVAGGAGTFDGQIVDAIYEIGESIIVSFELSDYAGEEVIHSGGLASLVLLTEDGGKSLARVRLVPYDEELGMYTVELSTDSLPPGHYELHIDMGAGTHDTQLIELAKPQS